MSDMDAPDSLGPLRLLLADCQLAIEEEIEAVQADLTRRQLDSPISTLAGRVRRKSGFGYRYEFQITGGMYDIRADDHVRLRAGGRESLGNVVAFDRASGLLQLDLTEWLGESLNGVELEFDPTWLLCELSTRLGELSMEPQNFFPKTVLNMFGREPPSLGVASSVLASSSDLNGPQSAALSRILGSDVQLVWGPPGTGKSRLVARAALELAREGRVLVTATTNGAVDEVASRLSRTADLAQLEGGRILRVGSDIRSDAIDSRLDFEACLARRIEAGAGNIAEVLEDIEGRLGVRQRPRADPEVHETSRPRSRAARLFALAGVRSDGEAARAAGRAILEISRQAAQMLEEADVVLTTLARLSVREELRSLHYESLIVDEISTAPLPYLALAASRTSRRTVGVGDFQQLPPVVVSRGPAARRWFRRDLFHETGVVSADRGHIALPSPNDGLCAMLNVQYRMAPDIRHIVSEFFYGGRLSDAPQITQSLPNGDPIVVFDTSSLDPTVERIDGSRRNSVHAEVVLEFLAEAGRVGTGDIGVVSPYRAHTTHLKDLVRRRLGESAPQGVQVSTIHRFQGREKRIVVIDTVDAPPGRSWFLDERRNPDFPRLLNVALSRARERLIIVAAVDGLRRTLPRDALLNRLLARLDHTATRFEVRSLTDLSILTGQILQPLK
jgi:hypothetical protein